MTQAGAADDALLRSVAGALSPDITHMAVAVSGGGDSVALLHLLARLAPGRGVSLRVVTVDHRLREASGAEAAFVADLCARLGLPHAVLIWDHGGAPAGNLMDQARNARHRLIGAWAQAQDVQAVAIGHTADDQAEGFLMALTRQAGLDGLSVMPPVRHHDGVSWLRPLLGHSRADLRAYLTRHAEAWVEDPTNADPRYLRVQARAALSGLETMGLTARHIAHSVGLLAVARSALEAGVADFARAHVTEAAGALTVDRAAFADMHPELQRRLVAAAVRWIGGGVHPARRTGQMQVLAAVLDGRGTTLGGVRFRPGPRTLRISREPRAVGGPVPPGQVWDGRWVVDGAATGEIRALGALGLAQLPDWRTCGVARDALVVSPGVWLGARLIAAPVAGFGQGFRAGISRSFGSFLLSH
ncbi:MAG: tRNA lysidine(34) synthetase TilS [Gemmobacter sp.]|nr:tRNA lysidine(34) synthetase TilS [Gemmobacter sp.]